MQNTGYEASRMPKPLPTPWQCHCCIPDPASIEDNKAHPLYLPSQCTIDNTYCTLQNGLNVAMYTKAATQYGLVILPWCKLESIETNLHCSATLSRSRSPRFLSSCSSRPSREGRQLPTWIPLRPRTAQRARPPLFQLCPLIRLFSAL